MFDISSLSVAPADAHPMVITQCDYKTVTAGGSGCVREICDLILFSQGKLLTEETAITQVASI